jgi:hypothetical protein
MKRKDHGLLLLYQTKLNIVFTVFIEHIFIKLITLFNEEQ